MYSRNIHLEVFLNRGAFSFRVFFNFYFRTPLNIYYGASRENLVNYFCKKTPPLIFYRVPNTTLLKLAILRNSQNISESFGTEVLFS